MSILSWLDQLQKFNFTEREEKEGIRVYEHRKRDEKSQSASSLLRVRDELLRRSNLSISSLAQVLLLFGFGSMFSINDDKNQNDERRDMKK